MAQTVVDLTLGTIRDWLVEEVRLLSGVGDQVKDVQKELLRMQSFLEDVDRRKSEKPTVLNYVKEIRSLSYRIEDVVDTYVAEVELRNREKGVKRVAGALGESKSVHKVGTDIAGIKAEISSLTASMDSYGIRAILDRQKPDVDEARKRWLWRLTYGVDQVEKDFVGRKEDIEILVAKLLDGDVRKHRTVSIWGMGGLGKTTSAEKIYHHEDIRRGFKAFAWVCISKDYMFENILQDMLGQLNPGKKHAAKGMHAADLVREVRKELEENKCLVVLDDVWELEDWERLQQAFPYANSKVLITTRNESVAKVGFSHPLGVLSEDEAWELLQKKAFASSDSRDMGMEPQAMEQLGRQMVRNCGYLPLAISVLGGILSAKKSLDAWKSLNEKIGVHMRGEGNDQKKIEGVLSLSYDDLPYRLKPCFLYLSRFPEDKLILVKDLCLFWMAEGLVRPQDREKDETLRDVAWRYLSELASRSLVQLEADDHPFSAASEERGVGEELNRCRVHDLLRDLSLAKSKEEEFFCLMDFRGGKRPSETSCLRRLAIYADDTLDGVPVTAKSSQSLRSLSLYAPRSFMASNINLFTGPIIDFNNLNLLRILYFERVNFEGKRLPTEMSKLILLKFLGFRKCGLEELPSWVGDLPFLQALLLGLPDETKIPNVFWKIKGLKYLRLPESFVAEEKLVLDCLDELETLENFHSNNCQMLDVSKLGNLRFLSAFIYENDNLCKFIDSIEARAKCLDLTYVAVNDCDFRSEEGMALLKKVFKSNILSLVLKNCYVSKLPDYERCFFPKLRELDLSGGKISEDPMSTLEHLSNLRNLVLCNCGVVEMTCHANGFPQLRILELFGLSNLKKWEVEEGAMPRLLHLDLQSCPQLDMIPDGIRFITTLQELLIIDMSEALKKRVEVGGEDFGKVCHVKSITKS